ncbi:MAG: hypothetical protein ACI88H_000300 [Cocleimonas sp.]
MTIRRIKPVKQGDLDGACGFYSIVNALKTLEKDFDEEELFTQVISGFLRDGDVNKFFDGTYRGTIKNTLSRVLEYINASYNLYDEKSSELYELTYNIPYWQLNEPKTRKQILDSVGQADNGKNCVCIIGYEHETGGHWSVVKKVSSKGLHMVDSSYEKSVIPFEELRVDSKQSKNRKKPYNLTSGDIFIISKKWTGEFLSN